jgi:hypothetical protein
MSDQEEKVINIQERTENKTREMMGEIEGLFDKYVTEWKELKNYSFLYNLGIKPAHARKIKVWAQERIMTWKEAVSSEDDQIKEEYSCYTKSQLNKCVSWWDCIIDDCDRLVADGKVLNKQNRLRKKLRTPTKSKKIKPIL